MEQLKQRYEKYIQDAIVIRQKAGPLSGIFGIGNGPQNDPAHVIFYEDVQAWVQQFLAKGPREQECFEAASFILRAPAELGQKDSYWMMYAAQGLAKDLVKGLTGEHCAWLLSFYDAHYPAKDRMPVQRELYKQLKKGTKSK